MDKNIDTNLEAHQHGLVNSFLNVAVGQSHNSARHFLESCNWELEKALQLFFAGNDQPHSYPTANSGQLCLFPPPPGRHDVPFPLPSPPVPSMPARREVLYAREQMERDQNNGRIIRRCKSSLLFHAPEDLLFNGSFFQAVEEASKLGKTLIINVLDTDKFESHAMNRDVWSDAVLADVIRGNFLFWQVNKEEEEGKKVCMFYHLSSLPAILVIDPLTGQKKWLTSGKVEPHALLEDLINHIQQPTLEQQKLSSTSMDADSSNAEIKCPEKSKEPEIDQIKYPIKRKESEINQIRFNGRTAQHLENITAPCDEKYPEKLKGPQIDQVKYPEKLKEPQIDQVKYLVKPKEQIKYPEKPKDPEIDQAKYPEKPEEPEIDQIKYPEEPPEEADKKSKRICRVSVRLPNGKRVQRRFSSSDPIQLLWSFGSSVLEEEDSTKPFWFVEAIPGAVRTFKYNDDLTFDKAKINNVVLSIVIEI